MASCMRAESHRKVVVQTLNNELRLTVKLNEGADSDHSLEVCKEGRSCKMTFHRLCCTSHKQKVVP